MRPHLNEHETPSLTMNYIATIRKLWNNIGYPKCDFDLKPVESTQTFKTIKSNWEEGPLEILKKIRINNVNRIMCMYVCILFFFDLANT